MMAASLNTPNPNPLLGGATPPRPQLPTGFGQGFPGMAALPGYPATSYPYYPLANPAMGSTGELSQVATTNTKLVEIHVRIN